MGLGDIILRRFKLLSIDDGISISTRYTKIGTKRFINNLTCTTVSDIFKYYGGLLNILNLRIFKDIISYYNDILDIKNLTAPLTPKEISDILHYFTDNVIFTIYD